MLNRGTAPTNDWLELEFFRSRRHLQNHITKKLPKASLTPVRATHHHSALDRFETNETRLKDGVRSTAEMVTVVAEGSATCLPQLAAGPHVVRP